MGSASGEPRPPGSAESVFTTGDIDEGLAPYVRRARADLAKRLAVEPEAIDVISAVLVVWPDSSLGCPAPGMRYATVAVDGAVIELAADGRVHRYHSGGSTRPFLCERPLRRVPRRM